MTEQATVLGAELWPPKRIAAEMIGSLPMGGVVMGTPIHTFAQSPKALSLLPNPSSLNPVRTDIDLAGLLGFVIDDVVTAQEAAYIIDASEYFGFREEAPGISTPPGMRMNKSVHWIGDEQMFGPLMNRIKALLPPEIDGAKLHSQLSHRINVYRYDDGDVFNQHIDGDWPGYGLDSSRQMMLEWPHLRSCLTMILYLNDPSDGVVGGNTRLRSLNGNWIDVTPKKGSALFFRHGFTKDSVLHIGAPVYGNIPKYVARINVMYQ